MKTLLKPDKIKDLSKDVAALATVTHSINKFHKFEMIELVYLFLLELASFADHDLIIDPKETESEFENRKEIFVTSITEKAFLLKDCLKEIERFNGNILVDFVNDYYSSIINKYQSLEYVPKSIKDLKINPEDITISTIENSSNYSKTTDSKSMFKETSNESIEDRIKRLKYEDRISGKFLACIDKVINETTIVYKLNDNHDFTFTGIIIYDNKYPDTIGKESKTLHKDAFKPVDVNMKIHTDNLTDSRFALYFKDYILVLRLEEPKNQHTFIGMIVDCRNHALIGQQITCHAKNYDTVRVIPLIYKNAFDKKPSDDDILGNPNQAIVDHLKIEEYSKAILWNTLAKTNPGCKDTSIKISGHYYKHISSPELIVYCDKDQDSKTTGFSGSVYLSNDPSLTAGFHSDNWYAPCFKPYSDFQEDGKEKISKNDFIETKIETERNVQLVNTPAVRPTPSKISYKGRFLRHNFKDDGYMIILCTEDLSDRLMTSEMIKGIVITSTKEFNSEIKSYFRKKFRLCITPKELGKAFHYDFATVD